MQWASSLTQLPAELAGKRRVTEAFAMLIVNTLLGENSNWHLAPRQARFTTEATEEHGEDRADDTRVAQPRGPQQARSWLDGVEVRGPQQARTWLDGVEAPPAVALLVSETAADDSASTLCPSVSSVVNGFSGTNEDVPASTSCSLVPFVVKNGLKPDRPVMGPPFNLSPLANAPINELGVIFLFGVLAGELGFQVDSMQGRFPDCEARRQVNPGKWQRQRIEFEYESKNFALHGHDPAHCDVIVCWRHNWRECPEELEVIELGRILGGR